MPSKRPTTKSAKAPRVRRNPPIHPLYTIFLLHIEPLTALLGALIAHLNPAAYLALTRHTYPTPALSSPQAYRTSILDLLLPQNGSTGDPAVDVSIRQLANLYLLFAVNEALVLRAARGIAVSGGGGGLEGMTRVWRALLAGLLIADVGHLWSVWGVSGEAGALYWRVWGWNVMDFGNVGVVYCGIGVRVAFLMGFGVGS